APVTLAPAVARSPASAVGRRRARRPPAAPARAPRVTVPAVGPATVQRLLPPAAGRRPLRGGPSPGGRRGPGRGSRSRSARRCAVSRKSGKSGKIMSLATSLSRLASPSTVTLRGRDGGEVVEGGESWLMLGVRRGRPQQGQKVAISSSRKAKRLPSPSRRKGG